MDLHSLDGFAADLFAGIPVNDFKTAADWYEMLLGRPPSFYPTDEEAVWQVGANQWLYIVVDPDRAGGAMLTVLGDDLPRLIEHITERGLRFDREEFPEANTRKVIYLDPDGNEIGFASTTM